MKFNGFDPPLKKSKKSIAGNQNPPYPLRMSDTAHATAAIEIVFHSYAAKRHFIARNGISGSEIIAETEGSITIADIGDNFQASPFVYAVKAA